MWVRIPPPLLSYGIKMVIELPPNFTFPERFYVACSGGVDSMALLSFVSRSKKKFSVVHFNHGTPNANRYQSYVQRFCQKNGIPLLVAGCQPYINSDISPELYWAEQRHNFFSSLDAPVLLAHHLNDAVETWLMSCLNGKPHIMHWRTRNCMRPLLLTPKCNLRRWCEKNNIPWIEDPTNQENGCQRNLIRNELMPKALEINPGLLTVIKKMLLETNDVRI